MPVRTYALLSSPMMHTPGILRWAQDGYKFKRDRKALLRVFVDGYAGDNAPSPEVFDRLLKGEIEWREEPGEHGPKVVFSVEAE